MITTAVAAKCAAAGLDLAQPLQVGWYNTAVEARLRLPDFGRAASLAILIGNTRALWPPFLAAIGRDPDLRADQHPVERYAMTAIGDAVRATGAGAEVRWAHAVGDGMVAMQRLAEIAGLAHLSPARLSVHPRFGPWIGLRAVAIFDVAGPRSRPVPAPACDACESGCAAALAQLAAARRPLDWRDWVAVRDACPRGRDHRYDDDQLEYHYTKNRQVIARALRDRDAAG